MSAAGVPLVLTPGDPLGIGPEVAVKAARALGVDAVLIGDYGRDLGPSSALTNRRLA